MKEEEADLFNYLRASHTKRSAFTVIETMIASFIFLIILAGLFWALNIGHFSSSLNSSKIELQSEVRLAMDWIIKDVRQAIRWDIADVANHDPSTVHLKFRLWDWNPITDSREPNNDYIEYNYDNDLKKITRAYYNDTTETTMLNEFHNIIEAPFYTTYNGPGDPGNELDAGTLQSLGELIVVVSGQKLFKGSLYIPFNLTALVNIRND